MKARRSAPVRARSPKTPKVGSSGGSREIGAQKGNPVFLALCKTYGIPAPVAEYRFDPERRWRFDYGFLFDSPAYPPGVALEVQGGLYSGRPCRVCGMRRGGRHNNATALLKEQEKLSRAACLGWRVLYRTPQNLCSQETVDLLRLALGL